MVKNYKIIYFVEIGTFFFFINHFCFRREYFQLSEYQQRNVINKQKKKNIECYALFVIVKTGDLKFLIKLSILFDISK